MLLSGFSSFGILWKSTLALFTCAAHASVISKCVFGAVVGCLAPGWVVLNEVFWEVLCCHIATLVCVQEGL